MHTKFSNHATGSLILWTHFSSVIIHCFKGLLVALACLLGRGHCIATHGLARLGQADTAGGQGIVRGRDLTHEPWARFRGRRIHGAHRTAHELRRRLNSFYNYVCSSKQYMDHCMKVPENAKHPHPVLPIVLPDLTELDEVEGEADPSNQNRYSPMSGLLHKYEMVSFVIRPCATPSTDSTKSYPLRRRLGGAPSLAGEIFQQWTNQRRSL